MYTGSEAVIHEERSAHPLFTEEVAAFLDRLHHHFDRKRRELLNKRESVVKQDKPVFTDIPLSKPVSLKNEDEVLAPAHKQLMLSAFYSDANRFIADFNNEKSSSWEMLMYWQQNLYDAIRMQSGFYLTNNTKTEIVLKPRPWHTEERNITKEGRSMSASLVDVGIFMFHNAKEMLHQDKSPHICLSHIHNHLEARLWNDVFIYVQNDLQIPQGSIKVTVMNETVTDPSQFRNILYEIADHATEFYYSMS